LKVLLTIPVAVYYQLLSLCELSSLEYAILKNAVVRDIDDDDESVVNLFCDSERARTLLAWATQVDPAAASQIKVDADPTT
jgi:hypothetical protein